MDLISCAHGSIRFKANVDSVFSLSCCLKVLSGYERRPFSALWKEPSVHRCGGSCDCIVYMFVERDGMRISSKSSATVRHGSFRRLSEFQRKLRLKPLDTYLIIYF